MFRKKKTKKSKEDAPIVEVQEGEVNTISAEQDEARQHGPLEATLLDFFTSADTRGDGRMDFADFSAAIQQLGTQLEEADIKDLFGKVDADGDGTISYNEFVPQAKEALQQKLAAIHPSGSEEGNDWIEFYSRTEGILYFNVATGEAQYELPPSYSGSEDELVADSFISHFQLRDPENTQFISFDDFCLDLQTDQLGLFLSSEEVEAIIQVHPPDEEDPTRMNYVTLAPLMRNYLTQLYAGRAEHPGDWARLISHHYGVIWFNKRTGAVQQDVPTAVLVAAQSAPGGIVPNIVEGTSVADARRASLLEAQLLELQRTIGKNGTGDGAVSSAEANSLKEEVEVLKAKLEESERALKLANDEKAALTSMNEGEEVDVAELVKAKLKLESDLSALQTSSQKSKDKLEGMLASSKSEVTVLQAEVDALRETLSGVENDRNKLQRDVHGLKKQLVNSRDAASGVAELQANIQDLQTRLRDARVLNEERSKNLNTARSQLKAMKEKMSVAEADVEQMERLREQLHEQREATRTTKSFLQSKTKVIQQKNEEIKTLRERVAELEVQDEKRSRILQNLLEKTTSLQAQIAEPSPSLGLVDSTAERRVLSSTQPGKQQGDPVSQYGPKKRVNAIKPAKGGRRTRAEGTVTFPPIRHGDRKSSQYLMKQMQQAQSGKRPSSVPTEEEDVAACHIRVGDRVLVKGPTVDGVVKQYMGTVKYVGRLDSEVIDYSLYAGLKMDDTIGDTDGLFKGKRYFKCPSRFGRFVPISDIISVVVSRAPKRRQTGALRGEQVTAS